MLSPNVCPFPLITWTFPKAFTDFSSFYAPLPTHLMYVFPKVLHWFHLFSHSSYWSNFFDLCAGCSYPSPAQISFLSFEPISPDGKCHRYGNSISWTLLLDPTPVYTPSQSLWQILRKGSCNISFILCPLISWMQKPEYFFSLTLPLNSSEPRVQSCISTLGVLSVQRHSVAYICWQIRNLSIRPLRWGSDICILNLIPAVSMWAQTYSISNLICPAENTEVSPACSVHLLHCRWLTALSPSDLCLEMPFSTHPI